MKRILFLAGLLIILFSCDDRFNFLSGYNTPPVITMGPNTTQGQTGNTYIFNDSVKTSLKHGQSSYNIPVSISDGNNNLKSISAGVGNGKAEILLNGKDLPGSIPVGANNYSFSLDKLVDGPIVVNISATDAFLSQSLFQLNLFAFDNVPPKAAFSFTNSSVNGDPYEYVFDASTSYDKDTKYGGGIQAYSWTINGIQLPPVTTAQVSQVFPGPGGYQVTLIVSDNDGAASAAVTQSIQVK